MLVFSESFDYYATSSIGDNESNRLLGLSGWYQFEGEVGISDFAVYEYGKSLSFAASDGATSTFSGVAFVLPESIQTGFIGMNLYIGDNVEEGVYAPSISFVDTGVLPGLDGMIEPHFSIVFGQFGTIRIFTGETDGDLFYSSPPGKWTTNTWFFVEIGTTIDATTGMIEVRINTVPICHYTNINTTGGVGDPVFGAVRLGSRGPSSTRDGAKEVWWDNIYVCDPEGDYNNTFLGLARAQGLMPAGDGDSTEWIPFDAMLSNWENASNMLIDDETYVSSATVGDFDLYEVNPLVNAPTIFAVTVKGAYRQTDATQRSVKNLIKSGATTAEGVEHFTSETYQMFKDIYEVNPDTDVAWVYTEVNGAQIGPKLES